MTRDGRHVQLFDQSSPRATDLLREFHEKVLLPSFPPEEYIAPATIEPADELAIIACGDNGLVLGGALGEVYSPALLLSYLAVRPGSRGTGVGSVLLSALMDRWLGQYSLAFVELADPRHHGPHAAYGDPAARLRFYGAFGIRLLKIPYFQPRLRKDLPRGYHLFLGVIPPDRTALPTTTDTHQVITFLREYFEVCEGRDALEDAEVRWLLDAVSERARIALVDTSEYDLLPDTVPPSADPSGAR